MSDDLLAQIAFLNRRYIDAEGRFILRFYNNSKWQYVGPFMYEIDCERYIPIIGGTEHEVIKLREVDYT